MKKLLFAVTLAGLMGLGASASEVTSANTFGVLKVASSQKQTIIAVPWVAVGNGESDIKVADLVMTSNLTAGDTLYFYNSGTKTYQAWQLDSNKAWVAVDSVENSGLTFGTKAQDQPAPRGSALILDRQDATKDIFLYGQYKSGTVEMPITAGAWNLIAPSTAAGAIITGDGSNVTMSGTPSDGDFIVLTADPTKHYTFKDGQGWGYKSSTYGSVWTSGLTIPAGQGAWYVSTAAETTDVKFTW